MEEPKNSWRNAVTHVNATILSAINQLNTGAWRILLVTDEHMHLLGVITDGDIRRHLLKQGSLDVTVDNIMCKNPVTASFAESQDNFLFKMHSRGILHLPMVDKNNCVVGLETFDSIFSNRTRDNWVIFMAGGMGKRLHPLTMDCPKPLLKIADKPISEILLENFIKYGFKNFYFSVNYKSEMIRDYYGSGARWGVNIEYIQENAALGTAGSLSLLSTAPDKPFFVINADILTNINLGCLLEYHQEKQNSLATLCVRQHQNTIPFGIVNIHEETHNLIAIEEKPTKTFFVNAGIYVLEPDVLKYLSFNHYCDMPQLLNQLVNNKLSVTTFPIREYWLDIGHHDHLVKAATDYLEIF
ncbi:MAG: sugar-phosphate nucleotide transferase [uncultured bacterium]|nr:MAG: sugar-phosphate nucleotide transferase [uncultured bacterium]